VSDDEELAKGLGPLAALTIGVGTMIGAGIFVLPGRAAVQAGPAVAVSFVVVNYVGAKETGCLQNVIVILLVAILTVFSILGFTQADLSTLQPFFPKGAEAILPGTALVFVSFLGFAKITTVTEEIKNPGRNLPLAVIGSVAIVTTMYATIIVALMSVINWDLLDRPTTRRAKRVERSIFEVGDPSLGMLAARVVAVRAPSLDQPFAQTLGACRCR